MRLFLNRLFLLLLILLSFSCRRDVRNESGKRTFVSDFNKVKYPRKFEHTTIASWNLCNLGKTKSEHTITEISNVLRDFDIVAIQEVVAIDPAGAQAVAKIADELNRMGSKWDYEISDPTQSPSSNMSERYAFLWKTSKVNLKHRAYLDGLLAPVCYREPYIAEFQPKAEPSFYVVNFHSRVYNDNPEVEIVHFIDYPVRLKSQRVIIVGDFNLSEKSDVWDPFYRIGFKNALTDKRTTLKRRCKSGDYLSHPIDNFYLASGISLIQTGSVDFIGDCDKLKKARKLSDHLPIFMEFK